jgi:ribosome biogenesis GTPase A
MKPLDNLFLVDYKQSISYLLNNLQQLQVFSQKFNFKNISELIDDLLNRLENNFFRIAVVGCFNRGKSTFINALLGQEVLPSDILATTATISRIAYRLTPGVKIYFKDGSNQEIKISELADCITKLTASSEAIAANIKESVVYYPLLYCQNNVEILDTPGLDDDGDMTTITSEVIKKCDVVIMLISAISPFSMIEQDFLTNQLINSVSRIIIIVNQVDLLNSNEDINKIINLIKNRLENCIQDWAALQPNPEECLKKISKIQIFGISAFEALQAKPTGNISLLAKSRFVNFEHALKTLINEERGLIQLQLFASQTIKCAREIFHAVVNQADELTLAQAKLKQNYQFINEEISILRRIKTDAIASVDNTFLNLKEKAKLLYFNLETQAKSSALQVIASNDINNFDQNNLARDLLNSIQIIVNNFITEIYGETRQALNIALMHLREFIKIFYQAIQKIQEEMNHLKIDSSLCDDMIVIIHSFHQICEQLSHQKFTKLSLEFNSNPNIFIFEEKSNMFVVTGAGAAIGFLVAGPLGAALGASMGAGINSSLTTNKFKEKYQSQVMEVIENQLKNLNINQTVDSYINQIYFQIKERQNWFFSEIDLLLEKTQNLLAEVYGNRAGASVIKYNELQQIQAELQQSIIYTQELYQHIRSLNT